MNNKFKNMTENWQDEKLVKEFRKIAQLCNLDVSYFGNVMSQRRIKWCKPIEKYHGRNLKYIPLIIKECKKFNISAVTILSPNLWIGDYGKILCAAERLSLSDFRDYCISDSKYVWKTQRSGKRTNSMTVRFIIITCLPGIAKSNMVHLNGMN